MSSSATTTSAPGSLEAGPRPCRDLETQRLTTGPKARARPPIINKRVRFIMFCQNEQAQLSPSFPGDNCLCRAARADPLLNRTGDVGENVIRIRADEPNRAHDDYENHGQHHGVFRNILPIFLAPQPPKMIHTFPPS